MSAHILLIEDEDLIGTMVQMNLESEGLRCSWLQRGDEVLEFLERQPADLILLDIAMPGLNGLELLEALRAQGVRTRVMMLTARGDVPSKVRALELGADDYLPKPFDLAELLARVRALLRRAQAENDRS